MYLCNSCRRKFTPRTGTVMERSHVPVHKWYRAIELLSGPGVSAQQLHRELRITLKTARSLTERIHRGGAGIPGVKKLLAATCPSRLRGRPAYQWTPSASQIVELMAAHGVRHADIGAAIQPSCGRNTLLKVFREELAMGRTRFKVVICQSLRILLTGRPAEYNARGDCIRAEVKPSPEVAVFQAKTVLGQRTNDPPSDFVKEKMEFRKWRTEYGLTAQEVHDLDRLLAKAMK